MKKLISALATTLIWCYFASLLWSQDTTPRGPSEWTPRNWLGFFIQIGLFILAIIGIYKLADCREATEEGRGGDKEGEEVSGQPRGT